MLKVIEASENILLFTYVLVFIKLCYNEKQKIEIR